MKNGEKPLAILGLSLSDGVLLGQTQHVHQSELYYVCQKLANANSEILWQHRFIPVESLRSVDSLAGAK